MSLSERKTEEIEKMTRVKNHLRRIISDLMRYYVLKYTRGAFSAMSLPDSFERETGKKITRHCKINILAVPGFAL